MTSARSSRRGTLTPMAAAGTMPKWESAEKRPPTLGSPWKTFRKPSRWACLSRSVPGSVMATKRLPAWPPRRLRVRSRKWARSAAGSMVVPDLDATMKSVRRRSISRSSERICAGTVESRTWSTGWPGTRPKVRAKTSGQRLEPPMPSTTAWAKPARRTSSETLPNSSRRARCCSTSRSQPTQRSSSLPVQRVESPRQRRAIFSPATHSATVPFTSRASDGGSVSLWGPTGGCRGRGFGAGAGAAGGEPGALRGGLGRRLRRRLRRRFRLWERASTGAWPPASPSPAACPSSASTCPSWPSPAFLRPIPLSGPLRRRTAENEGGRSPVQGGDGASDPPRRSAAAPVPSGPPPAPPSGRRGRPPRPTSGRGSGCRAGTRR